MSLALRYGASGAYFLATVLLGAALFFPVESMEPQSGDRKIHAGAWGVGGGLDAPNGNITRAGSWWDGQFADANGITMLRMAGPMIVIGLLVLLACGFMVLSGKGIQTGWTGTAGVLVGGLGMLLLLLGVSAFAKSAARTNSVLDSGIHPELGFWSMFIGLLLAAGAALASFNVKPPVLGRVGPDGQPLPPLPILSVENPAAFNPMANRDPRPFKQEEHEYKTFEVTGGRKTFKTGADEGDKEPPEEGSWEEMEAESAKPAVPKPGGAAKPGAAPARPGAKPATPAAAQGSAAPAPPAKPASSSPATPPAKAAPAPAKPKP